MKEKIRHLCKMIEHYKEMLDHASSPEEIGEALKMKALYETALLSLEEQQ